MGSNNFAQFGKNSFGGNLISSGNMSAIEPQTSNGDKSVPIWQICFKSGHTAAECWHKYIEITYLNPQGTLIKKASWIFDESEHFFTGIKKLPWKNLEYLDFRSNLLQGLFLDPSSNMKVFLISNNRFTREIPCLICNLSTIEVLDLPSNSLSGTIPESINWKL